MAKTAKEFVEGLERPFRDIKLRKTATLAKFLGIIETVTELQKAEIQTLMLAASRLTMSRAQLTKEQTKLIGTAEMQLPAVIPPRQKKQQMRDARGRYTKEGGYTRTEPFTREAKGPIFTEAEVTDDEKKVEPTTGASKEFEAMLEQLAKMNKGITNIAEYFLGKQVKDAETDKAGKTQDKKELKYLDRIWDELKGLHKTSKAGLLLNFFKGWIDKIVGGFGSVLSMIPKELLLGGLAAALATAVFKGLKDWWKDIGQPWWTDFAEQWKQNWESIKTAFKDLGKDIKEVFTDMLDFFSDLKEFLSTLFTEGWGAAKEFWKNRDADEEKGDKKPAFSRTQERAGRFSEKLDAAAEEERKEMMGGHLYEAPWSKYFKGAKKEKKKKEDDVYDVTKEGFEYVSEGDVLVDKDSLANATGGEKGDAIKNFRFTSDAEIKSILQNIRDVLKENSSIVAGNTAAVSQSTQNISMVSSNTNLNSYKSFFDMLSREEEI